ncbi:hypothetical protein VE03_05655 [Pseudogymnoascus sp. 23342-1-I1]|nr:hypothetical protein VE03_05655 [Pseudogymnoascus sp. 23342-1-I1]
MPSLKKWLRNKLPWNNDTPAKPTLTIDPLPLLPVERPSILTPSPSREALVSSMDSYGYFQLLPYEIRHQILVEALGGRTLHIDPLYLLWPVTKDHKFVVDNDGKTIYNPGPTWGWFGGECHQTTLWPDGIPESNFGEQEISDPGRLPCAGGCVDGRNHKECQLRGSGSCRVGIMGWLLACRPAYADAIDVVFTTNTIHMENYDLLRDLPRVILPQRLRCIESLELSWDFRPMSRVSGYKPLRLLWENPAAEDSDLHEMCRMVLKSFPRLRWLDINLLFETRNIPGGAERTILGPIEDMIRALGPEREVCIAIQRSVFSSIYDEHLELYGQELKTEVYNPYIARFWKDLGLGNGLGYWICAGFPDHCQLGNTYFNNY